MKKISLSFIVVLLVFLIPFAVSACKEQESEFYDLEGVSAQNIECEYDAQEHFITVQGALSGDYIMYKTNINDSYSSINPKFVDAGQYTVYYCVTRIVEGEKTGKFESSCFIKINKKEITVEKINDVTLDKTINSLSEFDGTTKATKNQHYSLNGVLGIDVVDINAVAVYNRSDLSANSATVTYTTELKGAKANNYYLEQGGSMTYGGKVELLLKRGSGAGGSVVVANNLELNKYYQINLKIKGELDSENYVTGGNDARLGFVTEGFEQGVTSHMFVKNNIDENYKELTFFTKCPTKTQTYVGADFNGVGEFSLGIIDCSFNDLFYVTNVEVVEINNPKIINFENNNAGILKLNDQELDSNKIYNLSFEMVNSRIYPLDYVNNPNSGYSSRFILMYGNQEIEFANYSLNPTQLRNWTEFNFTVKVGDLNKDFIGYNPSGKNVYLFNVDGYLDDRYIVKNISFEEQSSYGVIEKNNSQHGIINLASLSNVTLENSKYYRVEYEMQIATPYFNGYSGDSRFYYVFGNEQIEFMNFSTQNFMFKDWTRLSYTFQANTNAQDFVGMPLESIGFYLANVDGRVSDVYYIRNVSIVEETNLNVIMKNNSEHCVFNLNDAIEVELEEGKEYTVTFDILIKQKYSKYYTGNSRFYFVYGDSEIQYKDVKTDPSVYYTWTAVEYTFTFRSTKSSFVGLSLEAGGFYFANVDGQVGDVFYISNINIK